MSELAVPPHGEQVISWMTVRDQLFPPDDGGQVGHDDDAARDMHRLRGLVLGQAAETEELLARMVSVLVPSAKLDVPAGALLKTLDRALTGRPDVLEHISALQQIDEAIKLRNQCAHNTVEVGSSWQAFKTGGGRFEPVISLMGGNVVEESDLLAGLAVQQRGTEVAVRLAQALGCA